MKPKKTIYALILAASLLLNAACAQTAETPDIPDISGVSDASDGTSVHTEADTTEETTETAKEKETEAENTTQETTSAETEAGGTSDEEKTDSQTESAADDTSAVSETSLETTAAAAAETTTAATTAATTTATTATTTAAATTTTTASTPAVTAAETAASATSAVTTAADTTTTTTTAPAVSQTTAPVPSGNGMRDMTTMQIVKEMGLGINLGNTMESCGDWINKNGGVRAYETAWGSPVITEDMIKGYASCGFGVLRIPVAWSNLMDGSYNIDPAYMARVKEITDWALDSGMYAIVNIHYDGGWWEKFPSEKDKCMQKYTRIWEQISEAFKDYGDRLMFESLNEEGGWDSLWNRYGGGTAGKAESFGLLNEINQKFVDTVRSSGGNNAFRHLLIAGYNTDIDLTCDSAFVMPKDSAGRCAVSVHYYTPSNFCILEEDASWGKAKPDWGSSSDISELTRNMDKLKKTFVDKGIPVIIGEYGVATKNKTPETIRLFLSSVAKEAYQRDMCPLLWDITNVFYDRQKCGFIDGELLRQIMAAKN